MNAQEFFRTSHFIWILCMALLVKDREVIKGRN